MIWNDAGNPHPPASDLLVLCQPDSVKKNGEEGGPEDTNVNSGKGARGSKSSKIIHSVTGIIKAFVAPAANSPIIPIIIHHFDIFRCPNMRFFP